MQKRNMAAAIVMTLTILVGLPVLSRAEDSVLEPPTREAEEKPEKPERWGTPAPAEQAESASTQSAGASGTITIDDGGVEPAGRALDAAGKTMILDTARGVTISPAGGSTTTFGKKMTLDTSRNLQFKFSTSGGTPLEARIHEAASKVRDAGDATSREKATKELTKLLDEYFEQDMKNRTQELTDIQKRLQNLQTQLDRRRAKKQEIIDLQAKVVLNEADGLGFYGERKDQFFNFRTPGPMVMPLPAQPPGPPIYVPVPDAAASDDQLK
jgi:hypothetical protein